MPAKISEILKDLVHHFLALNRANQSYLVGGFLSVLMTVAIAVTKKADGIAAWAAVISGMAFGIGFILWIIDFAKKRLTQEKRAGLVNLIHLFVLYITFIPARVFVSEAIGLPPSDFDGTVQLTALWLYIPLWCFVLSVILLTWAILVCIFSSVHALCIMFVFNKIIRMLFFILNNKFCDLWESYHSDRQDRYKWLYANMLGSIALAVPLIVTWTVSSEILLSNNSPIKWVAYFVDYQKLDNYPKVKKGVRVKLHENGIVSSAVIEDFQVNIKVSKYPED